MIKVNIYFKSGNVVKFKCKKFNFTINKNTNERELKVIGFREKEWMIDLAEIECYIIKKCLL